MQASCSYTMQSCVQQCLCIGSANIGRPSSTSVPCRLYLKSSGGQKQLFAQGCSHHSRRRAGLHKVSAEIITGVGEVVEVEEVIGVRVLVGEDNRPRIEYLMKWKDGAPDTWEPVGNLADNLVRDFEDKWWNCCREGNEEAMQKLLDHSGNVLVHCVDSNNRSALHFVAAIGNEKCTRLLCEAGADVDYPDKDGYTPLHMAVGYSHVSTVKALLAAGAKPEIPDSQGRNVIQLVDSIRESMPLHPSLAGKRIALEEVSALLTGTLSEEVFPNKILDVRTSTAGGREFLVQWLDGEEDSWVKESDIADDVIQDYESGYEYSEAETLLKVKLRGDQRLYLVKWLDGSKNSWELEDHISPALVAAFEQRRGSGEGQPLELLPPPAEAPISKRAAKRARREARRAALQGVNGSENGNGVDQHHHQNGASVLHSEQELGRSNGAEVSEEKRQPVSATA